ncbi:MAG: undecaprenyldiphospho-muramoylpentapeptide beta-N-acetylglucosaminyltransferase [Patescibacteria group bacterium]
MSKRILLVGGGSGGHVFPLMAVAESLRTLDSSSELIIFGEGQFLENALKDKDIKYVKILAGKARRYISPLVVWDFIKIILGFFQSLWLVFRYMPDVVFCKGGYASVLPALIARLYRIPVYAHESDSVPGLANKIIGKFALAVFISFESAGKYFKEGKAVLVGNPVRLELLSGDKSIALQQFNLRADKKTVLVAGGSQGAKRINDAILEVLVQLVQTYQIIHQAGDSQLSAVKSVIDQYVKEGGDSYGAMVSANYRLYPFFNAQDLAMAYASADIIISRAGASNIFEISALGKPAIIIPITNSASNHQMENANEFQKYGAVVIEEANITPHIIINQIQELLEPAKYQEVSNKIKTFAKPEASNDIARVLLA